MKDLLGGLLVLVLMFGGGYCTGKHYEQEAQQAEVDRLNTEARAKEKALADAVTTTANALRVSNEKAKMATKQRDDYCVVAAEQDVDHNDLPESDPKFR